jgi:hypothetical protein
LVEHATENRSVGGSIPPLGTINKEFLLFNRGLILWVQMVPQLVAHSAFAGDLRSPWHPC